MINAKAYLSHQKTALADGFNDMVDSRLSTVSHTVNKLYSKSGKKSIISCLRGVDGIRTRSFCVRDRWSAISLPPQLTEAGVLIQSFLWKVNIYG